MHKSEVLVGFPLIVYPQILESILKWDALYAEKTIAIFILMLQNGIFPETEKNNEDSEDMDTLVVLPQSVWERIWQGFNWSLGIKQKDENTWRKSFELLL